MFCDLVGSTALSAKLDPEDLREIVRAYHRCCTAIVKHNGGYVPTTEWLLGLRMACISPIFPRLASGGR